MRISAGNYLDRSTGSVYVEINSAKIYFYERQIVAVVIGGVLYRAKEMENGIVYKRVRQAVMQSEAAHVSSIPRADLVEMAIGVLMKEVSEEVDKRLSKKEQEK